ncbi:MAG: hypothetical protein HC802_03675 [Caldilineaceae bacterium]|nr:hypothetical protein [Caldilineaceae bacterium]
MTDRDAASTKGRQLSEAKQALLEKRLRGNLKSAVEALAIPARDPAAPIPLSYAQERMWFLHQLDPQSPAYNMFNVVRLRGPLDPALLIQSFQLLVDRHDVLRTQFVPENGRPVQQIVPAIRFELPIQDLQSVGNPKQEIDLDGLIRAEIRRPFDLARCPLIRARLLKLAHDHHLLILTVHHAIFDEWSNDILWQELSAAYRALLDGRLPELTPLSVQYADFTLWQRSQADSQPSEQLAYWKRQLGFDLPVLRLHEKRPRPLQQSFNGAMQWRDLSASFYPRFRELSREFGATLFMTTLAAFQILLHRYTQELDILVGTPIAVRGHPDLKELIGLFLNTLVMRANFADDPRFADFVQQVRQTALEGYAHQEVPFEALVDQVRPRRHAGHNPIFQVMFVHQKNALNQIDLPGLTASQTPVDMGAAKFDLTLFVEEGEHNLRVGVEYNSDIYDIESAERMLGHYETLLESIVENPQQRVSKLPLLTGAERTLILERWNEAVLAPAADLCIHQLIEVHARSTPEEMAVIAEDAELTYGELDRRATSSPIPCGDWASSPTCRSRSCWNAQPR